MKQSESPGYCRQLWEMKITFSRNGALRGQKEQASSLSLPPLPQLPSSISRANQTCSGLLETFCLDNNLTSLDSLSLMSWPTWSKEVLVLVASAPAFNRTSLGPSPEISEGAVVRVHRPQSSCFDLGVCLYSVPCHQQVVLGPSLLDPQPSPCLSLLYLLPLWILIWLFPITSWFPPPSSLHHSLMNLHFSVRNRVSQLTKFTIFHLTIRTQMMLTCQSTEFHQFDPFLLFRDFRSFQYFLNCPISLWMGVEGWRM